jgi:putative MATE family efflux protein
MMTMLISAGVNTALDPIFIFGLNMGVSGAAWATVISQGSTALWLGWYFYRGKSDVTFKRSAIGLDGPILKETIAIGLSAFSRQSSASLTAVILNHSLGIYGGDLAIAAFGIIRRLMMFAIMPVFGVVQGLLPIIGFNYGGKQYCRVKMAVYLAIGFSTLLCTVGAVVLFIFPKFILSLFTNNSDVIALGTTASKIIAIGLPLVGFQTMASGMYQAIGKAFPAFILSILRTILLLIPMVLVLPLFWGLMGIWIAYPAADIGAFIVILFMFRVEMNYLRHTCDDEG